MKRFHVITMLTLVLGVAFTSVSAQKKPAQADPKQRAAQTVAKLKEGGLELSDDSWAKVQAVYEESFTKANTGTKPDREAVQKEREETNTKLKAVLTDEQYVKLQEIEKSKGPGGNQHGGAQHKKPKQ